MFAGRSRLRVASQILGPSAAVVGSCHLLQSTTENEGLDSDTKAYRSSSLSSSFFSGRYDSKTLISADSRWMNTLGSFPSAPMTIPITRCDGLDARTPTATSAHSGKEGYRAFFESLNALDSEDDDEPAIRGEGVKKQSGSTAERDSDEYPNFSRHGNNAVLPEYLTKQVYDELKDKATINGVRLEDMIRSGVTLPWGANPPRGIAGVYAGDAECYRTFAPLLMPLINHSNIKSGFKPTKRFKSGIRLQRHQSDLNYAHVMSKVLDPDGEYILYTRMRLARSIKGFRFAPCMSRKERRHIEKLLKECIMEWNSSSEVSPVDGEKGFSLGNGRYVSVMEMTNDQHDDLIQRRVLFPDPDSFALSAGLGRDWPDARGLYCDTWKDVPALMIWCNAEDHYHIISTAKGGDVRGVFTKLSNAVRELEQSLERRGYAFIEDKQLGYLNTSPTNVGTGLRASVYVKLVRLSRHPGFFDLVRRLRLEARSDYSESDKRFTGIYDIANAESLGKSEAELINIMIRGVGVLIEMEKRLEQGKEVDLLSVKV